MDETNDVRLFEFVSADGLICMRKLRKFMVAVQRWMICEQARHVVSQSDIVLRHVARQGINSTEICLLNNEQDWQEAKIRSEQFDVEEALEKRGVSHSENREYRAEYMKELHDLRAAEHLRPSAPSAWREREAEMEAGE